MGSLTVQRDNAGEIRRDKVSNVCFRGDTLL